MNISTKENTTNRSFNANFQTMADQSKTPILKINKNGAVIARGIYIPEALITFHDNDTSIINYPDTGVFVLFKNSLCSLKEEKYKRYIDVNSKTKIELVFQSRNAAAQFVLGENASTNCWKE